MVSCHQSRFPIVLRRPQRRVPRPDKRTKGRRSHPGKHRPCPLALLLTAIAPPALPKAAAPTAPPHFHQWQHKPHHEKAKRKNCAVKALSHDIAVSDSANRIMKKRFFTSSASRIMKKRFFTNGSTNRIMKKRKGKTALAKHCHMTLPSAAAQTASWKNAFSPAADKPHHEKTPFHQWQQRKPHHEKTPFHQQRKPHHEKAKSKNCAGKARSHDIAVNGSVSRIMKKFSRAPIVFLSPRHRYARCNPPARAVPRRCRWTAPHRQTWGSR